MRYFIPLEDLELEESDLSGKSIAARPDAGNTKNQPRDGTSPLNRRAERKDAVGLGGHGVDTIGLGGHGVDTIGLGGHGVDTIGLSGHEVDTIGLSGHEVDTIGSMPDRPPHRRSA
ncbi:MAG TPA: hypothetical protein VMS76_18180 [Planctomycetota bacterium]|nr:hypothetical protein [Planctomycetota bacterium]